MTPQSLPPALTERLSEAWQARLVRAWSWLTPAAFVFGFIVDALTLRRVDDIGDNVQLTLYLLGAAVLLVLERRAWHGRATPRLVRENRGLARLGLQFFFGGLFSAYFIFYSQSATLGPSVFFCVVLATLMLLNELAFTRMRPDVPQFALWFFCALSYLLFAVPTWTQSLGTGTRVAAGMLAIAASLLVVTAAHAGSVVEVAPPRSGPPRSLKRALVTSLTTWLTMLVGLLLLVHLGLVPPVPLALAEAGTYHSVSREGDEIVVTYARPPFWAFWRNDDSHFSWAKGEKVYCYSAIFAPDGADLTVLHAWEQKREGEWVETDRIGFDMKGGRDGGWRSWTSKQNLSPGQWRIRVLSEHGDRLGRIDFTIVARTGPAPELVEARL